MILLSSADFNVDEVEIRKVQLSDSLSKDSVRSVQLFENYMYLICIWFGHGGRGGGGQALTKDIRVQSSDKMFFFKLLFVHFLLARADKFANPCVAARNTKSAICSLPDTHCADCHISDVFLMAVCSIGTKSVINGKTLGGPS